MKCYAHGKADIQLTRQQYDFLTTTKNLRCCVEGFMSPLLERGATISAKKIAAYAENW